MKVEEQDRGNREIARFHGKEAEVKSVSPRTETRYEADGVDELAPHSEVPGSAPRGCAAKQQRIAIHSRRPDRVIEVLPKT